MVMSTAIEATIMVMVMDTTTIDTTTSSETLSLWRSDRADGWQRDRLDGLRTRRRLQFGIQRAAITAHAL
jgi:hypothetical protein